ncbi:DNA-3-methyladenine glycosylase I [Cupriavidus sp. 30B13]|uniref:DNA-3-methyladenine glycosylase I n=1 Tax=Cupriavidus sp. 30B13 TaxID=3384241 RepID=UPI003B914FFC
MVSKAGLQASVRCDWCGDLEDYCRYHDKEWGFPVQDDTRIFEKVCLEGFQAGLSWLTILRKREAFREAFSDFEIEHVARFSERDVQRLLGNRGIVRHRGKIQAAIHNAKCAQEMLRTESSLAAYFWQYEPDPRSRPTRVTLEVYRAMTISPESIALSKDLRKRGWQFVGPTNMYALMQALGLVNDHVEGCWARDAAFRAREKFKVPRT